MRAIFPCFLASVFAATASAQEPETSGPDSASAPGGGLDFRLDVGGSSLFETDIDDGGEIEIGRVGTRIGTAFDLDAQNSVDVAFDYEFESYDFSGSRGLAAIDPWEDVHHFMLRANWNLNVADAWTVFVGAAMGLSAEDGAVTTNAMVWGGQVGTRVRASETLLLGFGVMAMSEIDDDERIIPLIMVDWDFAENWKLRGGSVDLGSRNAPGLEAGWRFAEGWELAFGAAYDRRRFRLDDDGVAPDGVGEYEAIAAFARLKWDLASSTHLSLTAGVAAEGELTLENDSGRTVIDEDLDPGPFVGLRLSHRF